MTNTNTNQTQATSDMPSVGIRPWGSTPKKTNRYDDNLPKIPYMKLQPGINNVRIVTGIGEYFQVRWKGPRSKQSYGDRIRTSYPTYGDECPVKKYLGLEGKPRAMVVVIDRAANELKFLDVSPLVLEQIETNVEVKNSMREPGNKVSPRDFDISIKFDPKAKKATGFYSVVAHDSVPMTKKDLALIEEAGGQELIDKVLGLQILCPKPEKVIERLKALGWDGKPVVKADAKAAKLEDPEEDDYSFSRPSEDEEESAADGRE